MSTRRRPPRYHARAPPMLPDRPGPAWFRTRLSGAGGRGLGRARCPGRAPWTRVAETVKKETAPRRGVPRGRRALGRSEGGRSAGATSSGSLRLRGGRGLFPDVYECTRNAPRLQRATPRVPISARPSSVTVPDWNPHRFNALKICMKMPARPSPPTGRIVVCVTFPTWVPRGGTRR